ncbi:MAG: hypothetical protein V1875_10105 [Candidatus Altiarchaeota archaeon]
MDRKTQAIVGLGILVRIIFWLTAPVTGDGGLNFYASKYLADHIAPPAVGVVGVVPLWYPPLFHILTAIIYTATGILTLSPLVFGVAGLLMFHRFASRFYPKQSFTAAAVLAFLPFHVYYCGIGYFETLMFFLAVCALHFYYSFLESADSRDFAYAAGASALCALTHYHGFVVVAALSLHLFAKNWKKGLLFFVIAVVLASPWYARNYAVFGNPIWPKVSGGYYPKDVEAIQGRPFVDSIRDLPNPSRWVTLFFDFWIGAPNSGDELAHKIDVALKTYPYGMMPLLFWFLAALGFTLAAAYGAAHMVGHRRAMLPLILFLGSLVPFSSSVSARMFTPLAPFLIIAISEGVGKIDIKFEKSFKGAPMRSPAVVLAALLLICMLGASYAYSYTYRNIRAGYAPFWDEMASLPAGSRIIMPFNVQECLYFSGRQCLRLGTMGGGIPRPDGSDMERVLSQYRADYVCCTSINWDAQSLSDKAVCDSFTGRKAVIDYDSGNIWGRCWAA